MVLDPFVDYRNVVSVSNIKEFVKRKSEKGGKKPKIAIIYGRKHREGFEDYLENDTLLKSQASRYSRLPLAELFLEGNVSEYNFDQATEKWKVQEYDFRSIRDR